MEITYPNQHDYAEPEAVSDQRREHLRVIRGARPRKQEGPAGFVARMVSTHGRRFTCYTVVGITGVVVNTVLLYLLVSRLGLNHLVAAAISTEVSVLTNFALNDAWTFRDTRAGSWWIVRAAQYNAVALGGMVISLAVLAALTMGLGLHYLVANLFAMAASTLSNYALNTRFTWAGSIQSGPAPQRLSVVADV